MVKFLFVTVLLGLSLVPVVNAETFRARIVKVQGDVYVIDQSGKKRAPDRKKNLVLSNETIVTEKMSKAVIQLDDGAMSVLDGSSQLLVESGGWLSQLSGKIYYIFRKVMARDRTRKIKTRNATIGVRGTAFIVNLSKENEQIALQQGRLHIKANRDRFTIKRNPLSKDEFSAFKQQADNQQAQIWHEFQDYKNNMNKEFNEYKQSFELRENKIIEINDNQVIENGLDQEWQKQFESFEKFTGKYLKAY